ncbi:hypothetical protein SAMN05444392_11083 [Seinonella peptonophila]|uniref:Cro/C1-type HTH DNA-binding domain-containing protein n=1 Tax=Seinonella peptonophila TaxID=112248 RepID=A0A1M4ZS28_9BACL|nr:hypothetical protein [Seinonella peptonophila]SHF20808.1 hypothetical protein SAMN05444392_11083 [Seinonella peptonophila]
MSKNIDPNLLFTFEPFRIWFTTSHTTKRKMHVQKELGFGTKTMSKIWGDQFPMRSDIIAKICLTYDLKLDQVMRMRTKDEIEKLKESLD